MAIQKWNSDVAVTELIQLITPGVLGFYTHIEVTEVFAIQKGQESVVNVFSIIVAEEGLNETQQSPTYLNPKRIELKSLKGWNFGVKRYTQPISELGSTLKVLCNTEKWQQSGDTLNVDKVIPLPPQFVPPDSGVIVPLNRVLKNNFWNGSYLFEWSDQNKYALQPLFDDSRRLQELSESIQGYIPLALASLSDRLGNLIVQLPVTVLRSTFQCLQGNNGFLVETAWHPKAAPRDLRVNCDMEFDGFVSGYMSSPIQSPQTFLPTPSGRGVLRGVIWDEQNRTILAATSPTSFIQTISFGMQVADPEPRVFEIIQSDGSIKSHRINLVNQTMESLVGEPENDANGGWTRKRMYKDEVVRLKNERRFVQYNPKVRDRHTEHETALNDLRHLINQYGNKGVWLWDPYLSAHDILETLFYCKSSGSVLRALASELVPEEQRAVFNAVQSNWRGLCLEYRMKHGSAGWDFHDRFLIFPDTNRGALAWSLGTSVNSLGKAHHILQQVDDGQLIMDAFLELWNQLDQPEHLIWKKP